MRHLRPTAHLAASRMQAWVASAQEIIRALPGHFHQDAIITITTHLPHLISYQHHITLSPLTAQKALPAICQHQAPYLRSTLQHSTAAPSSAGGIVCVATPHLSSRSCGSSAASTPDTLKAAASALTAHLGTALWLRSAALARELNHERQFCGLCSSCCAAAVDCVQWQAQQASVSMRQELQWGRWQIQHTAAAVLTAPPWCGM